MNFFQSIIPSQPDWTLSICTLPPPLSSLFCSLRHHTNAISTSTGRPHSNSTHIAFLSIQLQQCRFCDQPLTSWKIRDAQLTLDPSPALPPLCPASSTFQSTISPSPPTSTEKSITSLVFHQVAISSKSASSVCVHFLAGPQILC